MLKEAKAPREDEKPTVNKEEIMTRAPSAYEAVVAIAKEARRLNAAPGMFLAEGEKAIPRAVKNFIEGRVEYEIEDDSRTGKKTRKRRRKSR
jgi:DNA-directed RNA polymerase subunit K/omega